MNNRQQSSSGYNNNRWVSGLVYLSFKTRLGTKSLQFSHGEIYIRKALNFEATKKNVFKIILVCIF